jgi:hypothetical protein
LALFWAERIGNSFLAAARYCAIVSLRVRRA